MQLKTKLTISMLSAVLAISCGKKEINHEDPLITNRDTTVVPGDDFFHYANGSWFKNHPIPSSESSNGIFRTINDTINAQIKSICEKSAANKDAAKGSNEQKIGDFYASGMDTVTIEKAGLKPLAATFSKISAITDVPTLMNTIGYLHTIGAGPAFNFYVSQDDKISSKNALFFSQGGLGLGQQEYYFNTDAENTKIRTEYVKHIEAIMKLTGDDAAKAKAAAATIMKLETDLARNSRKLEALRDPVKNYNKMTLAQFKTTTPSIAWENVLKQMGISNADTVIVGQPEFYKGLEKTITSYSIEDWKTYLKWDLVNSYASYLNKDIEKQNFYFYSTIMNGVKEQKPRWKRIVEQTDGSLGELIGQVYVKDYLPKGSKEKLLEIGNNIRDVYAEHIKNLDWMSAETKKKALYKLSKALIPLME